MAQYSDLNSYLQSLGNGPLPSDMPDWLKAQLFQTPTNTGSDSGTPQTQWSYQYNIKDQNGTPIVQLGDNYNAQRILDPSKIVKNDPVLGTYTPDSNIDHSHDHDSVGGLLGAINSINNPVAGPLAILSLGTLLPALGYGAATTAGANLVPGYIGAGEGDSAAVAAGLQSGATGSGAATVSGAATGALGSGFSGGSTGGLFSTGLSNGVLPGTGLSLNTDLAALTPGAGTSGGTGFLSSLLSGDIPGAGTAALNYATGHPLQALGLLQTAYGLAHGTGNTGASSSASSGANKSAVPGGSSALFSSRPQWTPNANTLAQLKFYGGGGL